MYYRQIRNYIVSGLYKYLNVPVVPTDDVGDKPNYPYISYKFITLNIPQGSHNLLKDTVPSLNENFEYDIEYTREEQPKMVISISTYSIDEVEAYQSALDAATWFNFHGYQHLKENGIVVVGTSNIQDRTIQIVDNHEKRQGFDVTIRVSKSDKMIIENIDKVNIRRD